MEATDRILKSAGIDETGSSWPIPVTGRKRRSLKTRWGDGVLSQPLLEGPGRKAPRNGTEPKKKKPRRSRRRCIAIGPERSETARRHGGGSLRLDHDRPKSNLALCGEDLRRVRQNGNSSGLPQLLEALERREQKTKNGNPLLGG